MRGGLLGGMAGIGGRSCGSGPNTGVDTSAMAMLNAELSLSIGSKEKLAIGAVLASHGVGILTRRSGLLANDQSH
jgi:hypothetical protein